MPSPFPGMNRHFKQAAYWLDFHTEFLSAFRRLLAPRVAPKYIVRFEEHMWLPEQDVARVPFLEIRDRQGRELITLIELLSPSHKRAGDDREPYLAKRRELLRSPTHLVEIDLLRGWAPMPQEGRPACDDSVMVSRAEKRRVADFWPIMLRDRLPIIPYRCGRRTCPHTSICKKHFITPTMGQVTSTSSIAANLSRAFRPAMQPGRSRSCQR